MARGGGGDVPIEPEGGGEDLPPLYQSSESTACETETARWGDMDEDDDMDFGYTEKPPSSEPPGRPGGDPRAEDHQDPLEDIHPVDPQEADPLAGGDPLDRVGPAEALLEDPLGTPTANREMVTQRSPGSGLSTSAGGSRPSSEM